ncbi:MAG: MauE/DoxX family redox-associated membrane protein [Geobacteraceae bacterium]
MKLTLRILLGFVLAAAAVAKLLNMPGFVAVLHSYGIFPKGTHWPAAILVTATELIVGSWLMWGRQLKKAAYASLGLHVMYAGFAAVMLLSNKLILNCGCFGSFFARPLSWTTFAENLVLAFLSYILVSRAVS